MELYLPPKVHPRTGSFLPGRSPWNKGKKWIDFMPEKSQDKIRKNLESGRVIGIVRPNEWRKRPVVMLHKGKIIGAFESITEAQRKTKINASNIRSVCAGKRTHAGGFQWMFETYLISQQ